MFLQLLEPMRHKQKMLPYKKMAIEWHQGMKTSMRQSYISFLVGRTEIFSEHAVLENVTKVCFFSLSSKILPLMLNL